MLDRLLHWLLGHQDPTNVSARAYLYSNAKWEVFHALAAFPELTNSLIHDAIVSEQSSPFFLKDSYELVAHLHNSDFHDITTEFPALFACLRSDIAILRGRMGDGTLERLAFTPIVIPGDSTSPRCGCIPHDPTAGYPLCGECHLHVTHVATLYVPLLPPDIHAFFPDDERETVIVVGHCEQCWGKVTVFVYRGAEIDTLVMSTNSGTDGMPFNEARVVTHWTPVRSHTDGWGLERICITGLHYEVEKVWSDMEKSSNSDQMGTYAGGFPAYVQGDEQPTPTSRLLFEFSDSPASTGLWSDCGTAQLWMETGEHYGKFQVTWNSS
jgi:hypothetical protein